MTLNELENRLRGASLDDVLWGGFVDDEGALAQFFALRDAVYFGFGARLVEFRTIGTTGTMRVALVEAVAPAGLDGDMVAAVSSVREEVLDDSTGRNKVVALRLWSAREIEAGLQCAAAQIDLANGQMIFLDPTYYFGIRLGAHDQKQRWFENWPGAIEADEVVLALNAE
jgi:hypothetical protein